MMSAQARIMVVVGVLIAVVTAGMTAFLVTSMRPAAATPPAPQVLTLAASSTGNTVTVVGLGTGTAVPDQANVYLGVTATRSSVRDADNVASNDLNRLINALHGQGVQDKDIQTNSISIQQQYNCCPQNVSGYTASSQLSVTVHHVNNVTPLVEAAVDAVGNDVQLGGINLSIADPSTVTKVARAAAMTNANAKAQDWARLAGHHIGGLIGVSEVIGFAPAQACDACGKGGGGGGFQVQPGQTMVTVTVAVTYELT
jgi:uncharacterized protein YggE